MLDILETYHGLFLLDRKKALLPLRGSSAIAACEWGRVVARPAAGCLAIFPLIRPQCCCVCLATVSANSKPGLSSLSAPGLNSLIIAVLGYMMCGIRFPLLPWAIFFISPHGSFWGCWISHMPKWHIWQEPPTQHGTETSYRWSRKLLVNLINLDLCCSILATMLKRECFLLT